MSNLNNPKIKKVYEEYLAEEKKFKALKQEYKLKIKEILATKAKQK